MSEAMSVQAVPAPVVYDFDCAYKLGRLCGEVRVLEWGAGAASAGERVAPAPATPPA